MMYRRVTAWVNTFLKLSFVASGNSLTRTEISGFMGLYLPLTFLATEAIFPWDGSIRGLAETSRALRVRDRRKDGYSESCGCRANSKIDCFCATKEKYSHVDGYIIQYVERPTAQGTVFTSNLVTTIVDS